MNGTRITGIYGRASTDKQALSPEGQLFACRFYAAERGAALPPLSSVAYSDLRTINGITIDSKQAIYFDHAVSGSKPLNDRQAGRQMLLDLERGDHLIVAAWDRLGRDQIDLITTWRLLVKRGVFCHFLDLLFLCKMVPEDPTVELMLSNFAAFAQYRKQQISRDTKRGMAARRASGYSVSSGTPIGFTRVLNPMWFEGAPRQVGKYINVPCPSSQSYFDKAYALRYVEGRSIAETHREMRSHPDHDNWSYWRLQDCLKSEYARRLKEVERIERKTVFGS
jgi:DNA invertase Pin-like site-specific DNA recombinase